MNCAVTTPKLPGAAVPFGASQGHTRKLGTGRYDRMVMPEEQQAPASFGPNAWLVDEMYEQFRADPSSVSESWQEFFADYRKPNGSSNGGAATVAVPAQQTAASPA